MGDLFRTCQDGHRCENGSVCVEAQEGSFYCDCETATGGDFVGLSCEFGAEQYCRRAASPTADWFCANQGACVELEVGGAIEWKCDCLAEYEGPVSQQIAALVQVTMALRLSNERLFSLKTALRVYQGGQT